MIQGTRLSLLVSSLTYLVLWISQDNFQKNVIQLLQSACSVTHHRFLTVLSWPTVVILALIWHFLGTILWFRQTPVFWWPTFWKAKVNSPDERIQLMFRACESVYVLDRCIVKILNFLSEDAILSLSSLWCLYFQTVYNIPVVYYFWINQWWSRRRFQNEHPLQALMQHGTFHLIVLDPPWPNRSVFRRKNYRTMKMLRKQRVKTTVTNTVTNVRCWKNSPIKSRDKQCQNQAELNFSMRDKTSYITTSQKKRRKDNVKNKQTILESRNYHSLETPHLHSHQNTRSNTDSTTRFMPNEFKFHECNRVHQWEGLLRMPVSQLAAHGALVVVWVTNNPAVSHFVVRQLLPRWNCTFLGKWWWLKLTTNGEPVVPCPNSHSDSRCPYEPVIIAQMQVRKEQQQPGNGQSHSSGTCKRHQGQKSSEQAKKSKCCTLKSEEIKCQKIGVNGFPQHQVICSVRTFHSQKPRLDKILSRWLPQHHEQNLQTNDTEMLATKRTNNPLKRPKVDKMETPIKQQVPHIRKLELFARDLKSGWVSAGNEVLKFQNRSYFYSNLRNWIYWHCIKRAFN